MKEWIYKYFNKYFKIIIKKKLFYIVQILYLERKYLHNNLQIIN